MAVHVEAMLAFKAMGVPTFDYGNNIRQVAADAGVTHAFDFPGFVPAYVRPLFCRGIGPFRWAALSGDPQDILRIDRALLETFPENKMLARWIAVTSGPCSGKASGISSTLVWCCSTTSVSPVRNSTAKGSEKA